MSTSEAAERARLELEGLTRNSTRWVVVSALVMIVSSLFIPTPYIAWVLIAGTVAGLAMAQRIFADVQGKITRATIMRLVQLCSSMSVGLPIAAVLQGGYDNPAVRAFAIFAAMLASMAISCSMSAKSFKSTK